MAATARHRWRFRAGWWNGRSTGTTRRSAMVSSLKRPWANAQPMSHTLKVEPPQVHAELVAALFSAAVPFTIMSATFVCVGVFIVAQSGDVVAGAATLVGLIAAGGKAWLHIWFRQERRILLNSEEAILWERRFSVFNLAFAAALGTLAARSFALVAEGSQLLATAMIFGFCSGQVARLAVRVRLCSLSICVAVVPSAMAAAVHGGAGHLGLATLFTLFVLGGLETVHYTYGQTRQRIAMNLELASVASLDPLTGLNNRLGLRRTISEQLSALHRTRPLLCVHCFDLDGFKAVNDRYGHATGDAVLVELARRVKCLLRDGDIAARLGGDEFVVLQAAIAHADEAEIFARRLCRSIGAPYSISEHSLTIGMSVGFCTGCPDADSFDDLLAIADQRMYTAKQSGGGVHNASARR